MDRELVQKVVAGYALKMAGYKPGFSVKKRRSAADRLKSRMYYRKNRAKIRLQRKRYNQKMKTMHNSRKLLKRDKPSWFGKPKSSKPKHNKGLLHHLFHGTKPNGPNSNGISSTSKFKIHKPKFRKPKILKPKTH